MRTIIVALALFFTTACAGHPSQADQPSDPSLPPFGYAAPCEALGPYLVTVDIQPEPAPDGSVIYVISCYLD